MLSDDFRRGGSAARASFTAAVAISLVLGWSLGVRAQTPGATLTVTATTQDGTIRLPGVTLALSTTTGQPVATEVSDGQGQFQFTALKPADYVVTATLNGFDPVARTVHVAAGQDAAAGLDLALAGVTEQVDVVAAFDEARPTIGGTLSPKGVLDSRTIDELPIRDNSVVTALKLLAGIVQGPGGMSIKGGRPNQSAVQIGMASLADPTTGTPLFRLPVDAIDSVEVLPNPYAVEFGRFSSGLTVVNTKRASDQWRATLNSPEVSFRTVRGRPFALKGLESFGPRIGVGGPIVKDKLFLEQSAQTRYEVSEVQSRSQDDTRTTKWLSAFSRLDANVGPNQTLTGTLNIFPSRTEDATLNTFNNPEMTPDVNDTLLSGNVAARTTLSETSVLESTVQIAGFSVDVARHGSGAMELVPQGNTGTYFNNQNRQTDTVQWAEAVSASHTIAGVEHLFKAGSDLLYTSFAGTSESVPVDIRRPDGTLARRLTFGGPIRQAVTSTDVALFAQDRAQLGSRLLLEAGGRIDHDGVLARLNVTPRVGAVVLLNDSGSSVLRGGYGLFFERTPSVVGAFDQFETTTDTRYAADGATPLAPPLVFVHRTARDLQTARSATWNLSFENRPAKHWFVRTSVLERRGGDELIVNPVVNAPAAQLRLSSGGKSLYREAELTVKYSPGPRFDMAGSYVRSTAYANLNAYTNFFDNIRWPVIGTDAYAPTANDTPNRFVGHVRANLGSKWLVSSIVEVRNGFPYSAVNEMLDWVGPRNQQYYLPAAVMVDLGVERRFHILKWQPWIGFRAYNALNAFVPSEVQANLASPFFGSFYNSYGRQIRLQIRIER